ncbi:MAG TPA: DUF2510 domain-containing protein, partial [Ilumatobacteraceae bacterium]|nr:DUF2510 domain-containing protein [Ilumatobacteraceae bacterium]
PDPDDTGGLRYFDGRAWSEHRARLHLPAPAPNQPTAAMCACGVVAIGRCRVCAEAYCSAHISSTAVDDRPFRKRWEPWTCGNCIEDAQREIRALQLARCDNVMMQMVRIPHLNRVKTPNGRRPPVISLFQHPRSPTERPPRYAQAYLVEYDGGPPNPTFEGLALSIDGSTVFNIGLPVAGVARQRFGPKRTITGYIVKNVIDIDRLSDAAAQPTTESWFEFAARSYLRCAHHIGIKPDFSLVFDPAPLPELEPASAAIADAEPHTVPARDMDHDEPAPAPTAANTSRSKRPKKPRAAATNPIDQPSDEPLISDDESRADGIPRPHVGDDGIINDVAHVEVPAADSSPSQEPAVRQPDPPASPPLPLPEP